jgi:prevent-host-death family protein
VETLIGIRELHQRASTYISRVRYAGERFIITSRDKPVAALISFTDYEEYRRLKQAAGESETP